MLCRTMLLGFRRSISLYTDVLHICLPRLLSIRWDIRSNWARLLVLPFDVPLVEDDVLVVAEALFDVLVLPFGATALLLVPVPLLLLSRSRYSDNSSRLLTA